jgi:hypothetical protein
MNSQFLAWTSALRATVSAVGLTALVSCGSPLSSEKTRSTETGPMLEDVISSNFTDKSCSCVNDGNCAMISDAVYGRFEARDLQCFKNNSDTSFHCVLEERFVRILDDKDFAGPWTSVSRTLARLPKGGWCEI